ncbi:hypothetical protein E2C01_025972 [Portunus trituberculatus]|uniref:Uncharacterized protein n=1 Tax=Portunus trituberculatus TaxID=210409 RepID=A0A5B7EEC2_PORTR|nr:hypothetical protein [Portunus trituberculatus]
MTGGGRDDKEQRKERDKSIRKRGVDKAEEERRGGVKILIEGREWEGGRRARSDQQSPQGHTIFTHTCQESMSTKGWAAASASSGSPILLHPSPLTEHLPSSLMSARVLPAAGCRWPRGARRQDGECTASWHEGAVGRGAWERGKVEAADKGCRRRLHLPVAGCGVRAAAIDCNQLITTPDDRHE